MRYKKNKNNSEIKGETMKSKKLIIAGLLALAPIIGFAQEWDDIYANPSNKKATVDLKKKKDEPQKKKIVVIEGVATDMNVVANGRDIDEYNRRGQLNDEIVYDNDTIFDEQDYQQYEYTDRIIKYHEPASSVKITGADQVTVYVGDDIYSDYYAYDRWNTNVYYGMGWGWNSFYPWYDPFYYGYGWGYPSWSYYGSWYSPWYSPWYYGHWGHHWHSPWYYGGYYGHAWYGGGYNWGYHDGYYSALTTNRVGRTSASYRTSSANSSGRTSLASGNRISTRSSSAVASGRTSSASNRGSGISSRTRVVDSSGRVYDSRSGQAVNRGSSTTRSSGSLNSGSRIYNSRSISKKL